MPDLATYVTYRDYIKDVEAFRANNRRKESARKEAFSDKVLAPEELAVAKKRGEVLKRTVDALDEYSQTKTEDTEAVTQTILGESVGLLTLMGGGMGALYQKTEGGKRLVKTLEKKLGRLSAAAPNIIPGASGLLFAVISSLPLLVPLTTIEIQTPRISRFEALKGELSNTNDFALLTDEQTVQAAAMARDVAPPKFKATNKGIIESINIFDEIKSYMEIVAKRAIYRKDKEAFEKRQSNKIHSSTKDMFTDVELKKADEEREVTQRLVQKIDFESQDYIERVFKIVDVVSMCIFGLGVVGGWTLDAAMSLLKVPKGKIKNGISILASLAGVVLLNSKIAEYRNDAIRIARHKKLNELMEDPTNFLKTPENNKKSEHKDIPTPKQSSLLAFIKEFKKDLKDYEEYTSTKMVEDKKFKIAARKIKLSDEQMKDARLRQMNFFKTINVVDDHKKKYEEAFEIFVVLLSSPMGLISAAAGNAVGWALHNIKKAPASKMPLYSIIGTVAGLIPAIFVELYTTIHVRHAARVSYMKAHDKLNDSSKFLDYSKIKLDDNPFLKLSFKNADKNN